MLYNRKLDLTAKWILILLVMYVLAAAVQTCVINLNRCETELVWINMLPYNHSVCNENIALP